MTSARSLPRLHLVEGGLVEDGQVAAWLDQHPRLWWLSVPASVEAPLAGRRRDGVRVPADTTREVHGYGRARPWSPAACRFRPDDAPAGE